MPASSGAGIAPAVAGTVAVVEKVTRWAGPATATAGGRSVRVMAYLSKFVPVVEDGTDGPAVWEGQLVGTADELAALVGQQATLRLEETLRVGRGELVAGGGWRGSGAPPF